MSHGASADGSSCEPNLTPLLDLVLQLVMFFMICANFVMEQVNESIKLPKATAARSLEAAESNILFLNVTKEGHLIHGVEIDRTPQQIEQTLKREFRLREQGAADKKKAENTLVILRADADAKFDSVFRILKSCKIAGFTRLQLRAIINNSLTG
jgi:biopolymer transport protein ExbD